jgi:hypothetical protein
MSYYFIADTNDWGIGFSFGSLNSFNYRYYIEVVFLCFRFEAWFWKRQEN